MESQAIVIIYSGKKPQDAVVEELARVMVTNNVAIPELLEIKHFDSKSMAKAIIAKAAIDFTNDDQDDTKIATKHALTLLSNMFNSEIRIANNGDFGLITLANAVNIAYYANDNDRNSERYRAFKEAMSIIAKNMVCRKDYKSYGWSDEVYRVFKSVAKP